MAIRLSRYRARMIRAHARETYPDECCGALLGEVNAEGKWVRSHRRLDNVHEDGHRRRFRVDPYALMLVEKEARAQGMKVLGFYHSHPDHPAVPSEYDRTHAWPGYSYIIVSSRPGRTGRMTSWIIEDEGAPFTQEEIERE